MEKVYDLVIIGSGPAGLSAAVYGMRARLSTLVLEKSGMSGGQVLNTYEVDNYLGFSEIGGFDLGMKFREHADKVGTEFMDAEVLALEKKENLVKILLEDGEILAKTVVAATGATHAKLGVKGELELAGMGVSYCATCDGAFFRDKITAVVGGGDVAVEDAIFLSRTCKKVYLIHRRDALRAAKSLQETLQQLPNVEILWDSVVTKIQGEERVAGICVENVKTKEMKEISLNGVFIAVGILPNSEIFKGQMEMDEKGYIVAGEDGKTSCKGVFAAGDVRTKPLRQIVTAVADGANVVSSVQEYLIGK